ncbi:MAG TPA: carbohydrate binding domain-containing protein [Actinomycetes bacterium]
MLALFGAAAPAVTPTTVAAAPSTPASAAPTATTAVPPDTTTPTATTVPGNLLGNPGFESGFDGWQPIGGARVDLADVAHEGGFGIRLSRGSTPSPGVAYPAVTSTKAKGATYVATAWVQATRPGITGEIHLLEYLHGRRFAVFRSGLDLRDRHWHRLQAAQLVHVKGSTLGLEVVAPDLPGRTDLMIDDVAVRLLVVLDQDNNRVLDALTTTTSAAGGFSIADKIPTNGVMSIRLIVKGPNGARIGFADHQMEAGHAMCPLPYTGPGHATVLLAFAAAVLVLGAALLRTQSYRGTHLAS